MSISWTEFSPSYNYPEDKPSEYRGIRFCRTTPHFLYRIFPKENCTVIRMLDGQWSTSELLRNAIDNFFTAFPKATPDDIYEAVVTKRGRGRPRKSNGNAS